MPKIKRRCLAETQAPAGTTKSAKCDIAVNPQKNVEGFFLGQAAKNTASQLDRHGWCGEKRDPFIPRISANGWPDKGKENPAGKH